jgi:hypothetical protein
VIPVVVTHKNLREYIHSPENIYLTFLKMKAKKLSFFLGAVARDELTVERTADLFVEANISIVNNYYHNLNLLSHLPHPRTALLQIINNAKCYPQLFLLLYESSQASVCRTWHLGKLLLLLVLVAQDLLSLPPLLLSVGDGS